jgi:hypothetical protein
VNKAQLECKSAYEAFSPQYNVKDVVMDAVWDFTFERPQPPKDFKSIPNYGLPKEERKFPLYSQKFIREMESKEGTDEYVEFVAQEWKRRYEGFFFYNGDILEYVTGHHYATLQYWLITVEDEGRNVRKNPNFRDSQRDLFYAIEFARKDQSSLGLIYLSFRRSGKTAVSIAEGYWDTTENEESVFAIQSKTEDDAAKVFRKLIPSWQRLPKWFKPVDTGESTVTRKLRFAEAKKKSAEDKEYKEVLNSEIYYVNAKEEALDGEYCSFIFGDEIGKTSKTIDVNERWNINRECLVSGNNVVGFSIQTTTVEDMEKYSSDKTLRLWERSNPADRKPNGRTDSGLYRLFFPAYYGYEGTHPQTGEPFVDEWGYSNITLAKNYIIANYNSLNGDDLLSYRRKYPIKVDDCFTVADAGNTYNQRKIHDQLTYNRQMVIDPIIRGTFYWENGERDANVVFKPDPGGRWLVAWMPPEEDRNKSEIRNGQRFPSRDFCKTGCDPFSHRQTYEAGSMGAAMTLLESHHSAPKIKFGFVCLYVSRPNHPHEFYEDMIMQSKFYSSPFLAESNKYGVLDHFHKRGYDGYAMYNPLDPDYMKKWSKGFRGIAMTHTDNREALMNMTQAYIMDHVGYKDDTDRCGFLPFDELLRDWQKFEPDNWTPYDLAVAAGITIIATKKPKIQVEVRYTESDWLPKFNNSGNLSRRV